MLRKPGFFIAGAPKCATTSLYQYLVEHSKIFLPQLKEPFYFCTDFPKFRRVTSEKRYDSLFEPAGEEYVAVGEASVFYLYSREAFSTIRKYNPDAKIIVMFRNPADMIPSLHSQYLVSYLEDEPDFEKAWRLQSSRADGNHIPAKCVEPKLLQYQAVASFGEQLGRLYEVFPRDQVHVVFFEDFLKDTRAAYLSVLDFLNVPDDGRTDFSAVNQRKSFKHPKLAGLIMRPPFPFNHIKSGLRRLFRAEGALRGFYRKLEAPKGKPVFTTELRGEIQDLMRPDIEKLEDLTGRDLNAWKRES